MVSLSLKALAGLGIAVVVQMEVWPGKVGQLAKLGQLLVVVGAHDRTCSEIRRCGCGIR